MGSGSVWAEGCEEVGRATVGESKELVLFAPSCQIFHEWRSNAVLPTDTTASGGMQEG